VTFFIAIDENGKHDVDIDLDQARDGVLFGSDSGDGFHLDVYEVTVTVPNAKARKLHLGTLKVAEDEGRITVKSVKTATE
jgi:hypothetical protein